VLNETHDPALSSWVESAQATGDFPIQNLPFAVFRRSGSREALRGGVAIGDQVVDLAAAVRRGLFGSVADAAPGSTISAALAARAPSLNDFMAAGPPAWSAVRLALSRALRRGAAQRAALESCLVPQSAVEFALPARIHDYTDFYTSIHHATAVGRLLRPDNPLLPNYKWLPIAYHGRCSSLGVSGQQFPRPMGQFLSSGATTPAHAPSGRLDYEPVSAQ